MLAVSCNGSAGASWRESRERTCTAVCIPVRNTTVVGTPAVEPSREAHQLGGAPPEVSWWFVVGRVCAIASVSYTWSTAADDEPGGLRPLPRVETCRALREWRLENPHDRAVRGLPRRQGRHTRHGCVPRRPRGHRQVHADRGSREV